MLKLTTKRNDALSMYVCFVKDEATDKEHLGIDMSGCEVYMQARDLTDNLVIDFGKLIEENISAGVFIAEAVPTENQLLKFDIEMRKDGKIISSETAYIDVVEDITK